VVQVVQVVHGCGVPAVRRGGTRSYVIGPVPPPTTTPDTGRGISRRCTTSPRKGKTPEPWPPPEYALPDDLDSIEHGRRTQRELFPDVPGDSKAARLARLLALPGVMTGDKLGVTR